MRLRQAGRDIFPGLLASGTVALAADWLSQHYNTPVMLFALLLGMAGRLKRDFGVPITCTLQGEDSFLDALAETHRAQCWQTLAELARRKVSTA